MFILRIQYTISENMCFSVINEKIRLTDMSALSGPRFDLCTENVVIAKEEQLRHKREERTFEGYF